MAFLVCGRFGWWPFRSVAVSVWGLFGLWPFRSVVVSVCGRFGLAISVCGRYDQKPGGTFCQLPHSYNGRAGFLFPLLLCVLVVCVNNWVHNGPKVVFVCLHNALNIIMNTCFKTFNIEDASQVYSSRVCVAIEPIISIFVYQIHAAVCLQLTPFSVDDCKNSCTLSYHHHHPNRKYEALAIV